MEIKLTLREILDAKPALEKLMKQDVGIAQSFKLKNKIKELNELYKEYDEERISLVKKLGEKDEETGNIEIKDPVKKSEFVLELEKLLNVEVSLKFDLLNLEDFEGIKLSATDALSLEKFFNSSE
jgi:hypothetical protein